MLKSHVIDVDGAFVGAAVSLDTGFRFIATDIRVEELDGTTWPSLSDVKHLASSLYRTWRFPKASRSAAAPSAVAGDRAA